MFRLCLLNNNKFILIHLQKLQVNFQVDVYLFFNNQIYKHTIVINNKKILVRKKIIQSKLSKYKTR
jgi:hypothetical protein